MLYLTYIVHRAIDRYVITKLFGDYNDNDGLCCIHPLGVLALLFPFYAAIALPTLVTDMVLLPVYCVAHGLKTIATCRK